MKSLIRKEVGTDDVEKHDEGQAKARKVKKNKSRDKNAIIKSMKKKLIDAEDSQKIAQKKKAKLRKKLEKEIGKDSKKYKTVIKRVKKQTNCLKEKIKVKNSTKVKHLTNKYKKKTSKIPPNLVKYEKATVFSDIAMEPFEKEEPLIIGDDVTVDGDEREALILTPKFACLNIVDDEKFEVDVEVCVAKHRWEVNFNAVGTEEQEMSKEDKEVDEMIEAQSRQIYDPESGKADMRRKKATDCKYNTRVGLPKARTPAEEALIEARKAEWNKILRDFIDQNCDEKGFQKSNLTPAQKRGLRKLMKRVNEGEVIVCLTDKSGKLAIMSVETYLEAGSAHTDKDQEVTLDDAKEIEKEVNGHTAMLMKIFRYGADWRHEERHRETKVNQSCSVSSMSLLVKDHKVWDPTEGPPKTRPVCGPGFNVHFSDIVSEILEPVANAMKHTAEVISTEDMVSKFNIYNEKSVHLEKLQPDGSICQQDGNICQQDGRICQQDGSICQQDGKMFQEGEGSEVIIGADADVLYPSLEGEMAGIAAKNAVMESSIEWEGVNYKEAARYIVLESSEAEVRTSKLRRVLPARKFKKGTRPKIAGPGPRGPEKVDDEEDQWVFPPVQLTKMEKKELVATVVQVAVKAIFRTHMYQFGGRLYHQMSGGPIGLRATGAIARIVMGDWDQKMKKILTENGIEVEISARYIDDIRDILRAIRRGVVWNGKQLVIDEQQKVEDERRNVTPTKKTSEVLNSIMNYVHKNLHFTMEINEDFPNNRLPTLDMEIWIENSRIMYKFWEKPMAAKTVIHRESALSENSKIASLSQEVMRRMKNTSEDVSMKERVGVINQYCTKLHSSGYGRDQVERIIVAGLTGYEKALESHRNGKKKLHIGAAEGARSRYRKKLLAKSKWFKDKPEEEAGVVTNDIKRKSCQSPTTTSSSAGWRKQATQANKQCPPTTTVLFVEQTRGGELAKKLREAEERLARLTGWKVRIVEKSGRTMKQMLVKSNPWSGGLCGRMDCHPCKSGKENQNCFKRNILYESVCLTCKQNDIVKVYVGESARSSYERGGEHARDYAKRAEDSHMHKHAMSEHAEEEKPTFQFNIVKTFQSALTRQISEAVRIRRRGEGILNSKGVYNRCALPRLVVEQPPATPAPTDEESFSVQPAPAEWKTTSQRRKKRRQEEEESDCQRGGRKTKKQKLCKEQQWGEQVPERFQRIRKFLMGGNEQPKQSLTLKQLTLKLVTEGESIVKQVLNSIIDIATQAVGMRVELGVEHENQNLNMCYSIFEGGIGEIIEDILSSSVTRSSTTNLTISRNTNLKKLEWESGARAVVRLMADTAVEKVESERELTNTRTNLGTTASMKMEQEAATIRTENLDESAVRKSELSFLSFSKFTTKQKIKPTKPSFSRSNSKKAISGIFKSFKQPKLSFSPSRPDQPSRGLVRTPESNAKRKRQRDTDGTEDKVKKRQRPLKYSEQHDLVGGLRYSQGKITSFFTAPRGQQNGGKKVIKGELQTG